MLALVVLALAEMQAGREVSAGLLVAAAIVLKPYAVLLLPWLVARRRLPSIAGAAIGTTVALLLPISVYGFEGNAHLLADWWRTVTDTTSSNLGDFNNVSAASVFARWLGPGAAAQALAVALVLALLAVAAAVFFKRSRVPAPEPLEAGLLLTMMPIISPQGWDYVFLLSTLATMLLINYRAKLPSVMKAIRHRRAHRHRLQHLRPRRTGRLPAFDAAVDHHYLLSDRHRRPRRSPLAQGCVSRLRSAAGNYIACVVFCARQPHP